MRLSVSTTFAKDHSRLYSALKLCEEYNIDSVEIGSNHIYEKNYDYIIDHFNCDYLVHNYFPVPEESVVVNIASLNDQILKRSIQHIKTAIDFSTKIGAELYTFHPGFLVDPKGISETEHNYDFQWDNLTFSNKNFELAFDTMLQSMDRIVSYANQKNMRVAFETEGSFHRRAYLLMQHPEEYEKLFKEYASGDLGINLNISHLNLAAKAFGFSRESFVDLVSDYVVAIEMSHNNGREDQHLPLIGNAWYWPVIFDKRFRNVYKIMEYRNVEIKTIVENMSLYREIEHAF